MKPIKVRFEEKFIPEPMSGCWLWTGSTGRDGYGYFQYATRKTATAHRTAYRIYVAGIPEGKHILHTCDTPCCVNPDHLTIGTHGENMRQMERRGRSTRGEAAKRAKLTDQMVREIRSSKEYGTTLAKRYGLAQSTVYMVRSGLRWTHVK